MPKKELGNLYIKLGDYDNGIKIFVKAIEDAELYYSIDIDDFAKKMAIYADLANAYNRKKDIKSSIAICKKGLAIIENSNFYKKTTLDTKFYINTSLIESYLLNDNATLALQYAQENITIASQLDEPFICSAAYEALAL